MLRTPRLSSYERRTLAIENLSRVLEKLVSSVDDLVTAAQAETSAEQSAITLIQTLAAKLPTISDDPRIAEVAAQLQANAAALGAAVVANTPTAPAAPAA